MAGNEPVNPPSPTIIEISTDGSEETSPSTVPASMSVNSRGLPTTNIMSLADMIQNSCEEIHDSILDTGLHSNNVQPIKITTVENVHETFHSLCKKIEALSNLLKELYYDHYYNEGNVATIKCTFQRLF